MTQSSKALKRYNHLLSETNAAYHELSVQLGLSDSVMQILYTICYQGRTRCALQEIRIQTGISKQTINSALRKLEAAGIIYLEPVGGKSKDVCLTEQGVLLAERTAARVIAVENAVFSAWSQEDVEKYLELVEKYLNGFRNQVCALKTEAGGIHDTAIRSL